MLYYVLHGDMSLVIYKNNLCLHLFRIRNNESHTILSLNNRLELQCTVSTIMTKIC